MEPSNVLAILKEHEAELKRLGVQHAALFGSTARGEAGSTSDLDIMVDIDPEAPVGVFEYVGIVQLLSHLFPVKVDVSNRAAQRADVRETAERDAIYAF